MIEAGGNEKLHHSRVLVVDYHQSDRSNLVTLLTELGFEAIEAEDGIQALEMFKEFRPWLVITEVFLPQLDGFEAARQIKLLAGDVFVPVLFVTRSRDESVYERCVEAGGDDFLNGPITSQGVLKAKLVAMQRITQLYHEVHGLHRLLQREEEVAEELLSGAVEGANTALDQVRIYKRPASTFCGDVQLTAYRPDGDLNILLGDFTGHGLTSVIGALPLSETFRAMTRKGYSGDEILQQINNKLKALLPPGMFLATIMVRVSSSDSQVYVWNCGMPSVLVMSAEERDLKCAIESSDPPLGIINNFVPMAAQVIPVAPDDRLLLFSDGLPEARNPAGDMFGEERLLDAARDGMAVCNLADRVMYAVSSFMDGREQDDDVSLIEIPARIRAPVSTVVHAEAEPGGRETLPGMPDQAEGGWSWEVKLQSDALQRVNPVPMLLSQLQEMEGSGEHWQVVFTILTELYVNALDHGVLQIPGGLKSNPDGFSQYFEQREQKLKALKQGYVDIDLEFRPIFSGTAKVGGRLLIHVRDSGEGFDYDSWEANRCEVPLEERVMALSGRGITLVRELADSLNYHEGGRQAEVIFSWSDH